MPVDTNRLRIAAVGDIHYSLAAPKALQPFLAGVDESADVLLICGDLTSYGLPEEAHALAGELASCLTIPTITVLGNHDYESGQQAEMAKILRDVGVLVLDGTAVELYGLGFAGAKGFGGGFGNSAMSNWGEAATKQYVREASAEAEKLESALAALQTSRRVVLLHYSPIKATVVGESPEIYAFMGSSRLEEPLARHPVDVVFHGHAHAGSFEGRSSHGVPVYNVAVPVLKRQFPEQLPFFLWEATLDASDLAGINFETLHTGQN